MTADPTEIWKVRLVDAIENSGMTYRAISIECGKGKGYIHQLVKQNKEPSISTAIKICEVIGVSPASVLLGIDLSAKADEFIKIFAQLPDAKQDNILDFIRGMVKDEESK